MGEIGGKFEGVPWGCLKKTSGKFLKKGGEKVISGKKSSSKNLGKPGTKFCGGFKNPQKVSGV